MANIIIGNKMADVVLVKGKCYSFLQTTTESVTNTLSEVSGVFSTCADCWDSDIRIEKNQEIDIGTRTDDMNFIFNCLDGESAMIIVNSVSFEIANEGDLLVWDRGGAGEHTFTTQYETISRTAGSETFDVVLISNEYPNFGLMNFS